jgi:hypothetical protein
MKMRSITDRVFVSLAALALTLAAVPLTLEAQRVFPNPTVEAVPFTTPVDAEARNHPFYSQAEWLAPHGYIEEEFFLAGTANRYDVAAGTITDGGHPYRTRMVVRRPASQSDFNGTVLLEWQNVTAGYDLDALWSPVREHLVEAGYAWVGLSAQRVGVNHLREWSPARYGSLDVTDGGAITDDAISYDIFGQAAKAIRAPSGVDPMGGLQVREIIGKGASQSASRLTPFYNAVQPLHEPVIDLLYLAVGGGETRTDAPIPVFRILAETDVISSIARGEPQPDSDLHRRWEVAGTSHSGYAGFVGRMEVFERDQGSPPVIPTCDRPAYSRIPMPNVMQAAYHHMVNWVRDGTPPPSAPLMTREDRSLARNELGLGLGGIQLPELAAPTAYNTGVNSGSGFCRLYGSHEPMEPETLRKLYRDEADYLAKVRESAEANVRAGFLLPGDAERTIEMAKEFKLPAE